MLKDRGGFQKGAYLRGELNQYLIFLWKRVVFKTKTIFNKQQGI